MHGKVLWRFKRACIKNDNLWKKRNDAPTYEKNKFYKQQEVCYICKKEFNTDKNDKKAFKQNHKVGDHGYCTGKYLGTTHNICNLRYKISEEIPLVFQKGSTYNYHFIINKLAKELEGKFEYLGENAEEYITFSVPIKKELDNGKTVTYKLKFIDRFRFMSSSLSSLVNNVYEIFSKICRGCREKIKNESVCDFIVLKSNKLHHKCNIF